MKRKLTGGHLLLLIAVIGAALFFLARSSITDEEVKRREGDMSIRKIEFINHGKQ